MKQLIEKCLTRIPMYIFVIGALTLVYITAVVQILIGSLELTLIELLASTGVLLTSGLVVSYVPGWLYRAPSHLPSATITSLILGLLLLPTTDIVTLSQYGLISVIAMASKYVVAYRSRHIFNPAAFGVFVSGILDLQYASWWVGSPVLFAVVLVTSLSVLYKTRQLVMGSLFVVLGVTLVTLNMLALGDAPEGVLGTVLTSWPFIFMAGFMLSEPLTLPPRQWQRNTIAIMAAVIIATPISVGIVDFTPEFALLIANLAAFMMAFRQRRGLSLTLQKRHELTSTADEFVFEPSAKLDFEAGQYVELNIPHSGVDMRGTRRFFSITSAPGEPDLRLGVKFFDGGSTFKKALLSLPEKATIRATGIYGDFILPRDTDQKLLFIAGGIGVTPFISHVLTSRGEGRDITLLYFVSSRDEIAYKNLLKKSKVRVKFLVDSRLTPDLLYQHVPDSYGRRAYVSGPPAMVAATKKVLRGRTKSIKTDYFSGY